MQRHLNIAAAAVLACGLAAGTTALAQNRQRGAVIVNRGGTSYLGIGVADIDAERAKALNLKEEHGVEVKSVTADGPAAKAGVKEGDVVLDYNGQRVEGIEQFQRLVRETPAGRQARLTVWRGGTTQALTVTLGTRKGTIIQTPEGEYSFEVPAVPPMPPMPPMPDMPRFQMSWRNASLGVECESLSAQLAEFFGVKDGVLVRSVVKDSAAEKAGIKAGDVITKVDETAVTSPREISSMLHSLRAKKTFPLVLVRNKKEMTVTVTLEEQGSREGTRAESRGHRGMTL